MTDRERLLDDLPAASATSASGCGKAPALAHALRGRSRVARAVMNWVHLSGRAGVSVRRAEVNGAGRESRHSVIGGLLLNRPARHAEVTLTEAATS